MALIVNFLLKQYSYIIGYNNNKALLITLYTERLKKIRHHLS